jgi:hypothetical protein
MSMNETNSNNTPKPAQKPDTAMVDVLTRIAVAIEAQTSAIETFIDEFREFHVDHLIANGESGLAYQIGQRWQAEAARNG